MAHDRPQHTSPLGYLSHGLVWLYGLLLAVPIYYLLVTAFKDNTAIFSSPAAPPTTFRFDNFINAFQFVDLGHALINSTGITIGAEILTLLLAMPAAYALARSEGKLGEFIEKLFAAGFLIPAFAALVPTVLLAIAMGLFYNPLFLVIFFPATQLPLSVLLLTQFMRAIPKELEESAMMDGASRWAILWRVYTPMIIPGLVTVALLNFLTFWNEYLFSLSILGTDTATRTVQVAVPSLIGQQTTDYGLLAAGCLISLIPVFLVYVLMQRRMENALVAGAVKG
ncbi:transporter [Subtercola boreus]|uniref:Transporter n=1 Tax=Subtercola boreus TaxID=120213 RepID=A0A3E0W3G8_9MICO|nr:carbohydrate ABC transporter permease [Subtercola boreus]RFA16736.1 transporter [Subtercola boreus]